MTGTREHQAACPCSRLAAAACDSTCVVCAHFGSPASRGKGVSRTSRTNKDRTQFSFPGPRLPIDDDAGLAVFRATSFRFLIRLFPWRLMTRTLSRAKRLRRSLRQTRMTKTARCRKQTGCEPLFYSSRGFLLEGAPEAHCRGDCVESRSSTGKIEGCTQGLMNFGTPLLLVSYFLTLRFFFARSSLYHCS